MKKTCNRSNMAAVYLGMMHRRHNMKRMIAIVMMLAISGIAFAQDAAEPATEDEAIALLRQQATQLQLARRDRTEATSALKEMVKAQIRVENAWRLVSDALDKGLKAGEMKELASQAKLNTRQGLSAEQCESQLQTMVQERVRERTQTESGTTVRTQTQTQTQTRTEAPAGAGTASGSGSGPQTGKGN